MFRFVLEKMCGFIKTGVRTDKGFKEVHLTTVAKALFEHCGIDVSSTQVYNHPRKWRQRWITITRLRDLSEAQWCDDSKCIILERSPKDVEFLNVPIANYDEMHTIFSFSLATDKYAAACDGAFADDELVAFTNMIFAVKDFAQAIRDNKPTYMHPDLYNTVMDMLGFPRRVSWWR
ncbi:hypothetical protein QYE76_057360 [Lolium multiflorum]|uniref:Uncharacterized protein n=1 Tax=Lolium multiflorum TaxID=4521 RepID=A0AAD8T4R5_LOLMU|nr:hypothetical protein QYE76_057360 [Lolium multiflorum]